MPIKIPKSLPATAILEDENIFVISEERAKVQNIRPLEILLFNLMPKKIETETQILRLLSNSPLQINIELLQTSTYEPKNTSQKHLLSFYKTFADIANKNYDGLIITGAPVEHLPFETIAYWDELCSILEWSRTHVFSKFFICWSAIAALWYFYKIPRHIVNNKICGIFEHTIVNERHNLLRGFDNIFYAPHSRYFTILEDDLQKHNCLELLATSQNAGPYIIASKDQREFYVTGHSEYDRDTLKNEYLRDLEKSSPVALPYHYFKDNDCKKEPIFNWRSHGALLFSNWINHIVYQNTPYDLSQFC